MLCIKPQVSEYLTLDAAVIQTECGGCTVDVRFAVGNDPHYHGRFSHPHEQSARSDESHHGTREIKLQLLIGG